MDDKIEIGRWYRTASTPDARVTEEPFRRNGECWVTVEYDQWGATVSHTIRASDLIEPLD